MKFNRIKQLTHSPLPRINKIKNGKIYFTCTCGASSNKPLRQFTMLSRCPNCVKANNTVLSHWDLEKTEELFEELYELVLYHFIFKGGDNVRAC